jgi:hypothetical protein
MIAKSSDISALHACSLVSLMHMGQEPPCCGAHLTSVTTSGGEVGKALCGRYSCPMLSSCVLGGVSSSVSAKRRPS